MEQLSKDIPYNFKMLAVETDDPGYQKPLTENKNPAAKAETAKETDKKLNQESLKKFTSLVAEGKIPEARKLIDEVTAKKDFDTGKEMINVWKQAIDNRTQQDVKDGTLKHFTKNIIEEKGPLREAFEHVTNAEFDTNIGPKFEENKKRLDEAIQKLTSPAKPLKPETKQETIAPSPKEESQTPTLSNVGATDSENSSLLQAIANNTGNSNSNMTSFANGFNMMAKALEKVGEAVGEKVKIPPVVVNNSAGGGQQPKVSSTEIAKQGNPAISQFRAMMENYRPIPA